MKARGERALATGRHRELRERMKEELSAFFFDVIADAQQFLIGDNSTAA